MKKIKYNEWQGNDKFRNLIDGKHQFVFNRGGRGTGKTISTVREIIAKIIIGKKQDVLILRNVETSNRQSIYKEFKSEIDRISSKWTATVSPLEITINGCSIIFRGMDKPERLKSIGGNIGCVLFEEATEYSSWEDCQIVIQSIRKVKDPVFIFNYNADNPIHWLRTMEENLPPKSKLIVSTIFDNKYLTEDFITRQLAQKEIDEKLYNVNVLGMWQNLGTTVYEVTEANFLGDQKESLYDIISIGIDLGDVNPTTFVAVGIKDGFKKFDILENYAHANKDNEIKKSWSTYADDFKGFYDNIREKYPHRSIAVTVETATGGIGFKQMLLERRIMAVGVKKDRVKDRVMYVDYLLKTGRMRMRKNQPIHTELVQATRNLDAKNNDYFRLDKGDHSINALEYAIIKYRKYSGIGGD